jgi:hypothetical protein
MNGKYFLYFALIIISAVSCINDASDEADEIYRRINEGFTSQDQDALMELFAKDDYNASNFDEITELNAEIDIAGIKLSVFNT